MLRRWKNIFAELSAYEASIVAVTETWLSDDITQYYTYENFQKFHKCRQGGGGGGVALFFNASFKVMEIAPAVSPPASCQVLSVLDVRKKHCWTLVYRPPYTSAGDTRQLIECLHSIIAEHQCSTILGDFNLREISWKEASSPAACSELSFEFLELWAAWDMEQLVRQPTRGDNYLDLILTTEVSSFSSVTIQPPVSTNDHCLVHGFWKFVMPPHIRNIRRNFYKANYDIMANVLATTIWRSIFAECRTDNDYWLSLYNVLMQLIQHHVPLVFDSNRSSKKLPKSLRLEVLKKRKAWKKWRNAPTKANKRAYNTQSLVCSQRIKDYRAHKEDDLLTLDTKHFFSYGSKNLNASSDCINLKSNDGSMLTSSIDIVQCLSAEFSKNFSLTNSTLPNLSKPCSGDDEVRLEDISFGVDEVQKVLSSQGHSAPGPDGIPGVFYNKLAPVLTLPMCIVFHQSLYQRAIPDMWRSANITPIFKGKGEREAPSSFRPISLTDVACKHLERLVGRQIQDFWLSNGIICNNQHGFRPHRSTTTNLVECDAFISNILNSGHSCDVILIDFKRAFDKVPHADLINKLYSMRLGSSVVEWISDLLHNRSQKVVYKGAASNPCHVTSGVIQGSALGPLMFSAYINDLPCRIKYGSIFLFADDGKAVTIVDDKQHHDLFQEDMSSVGDLSD